MRTKAHRYSATVPAATFTSGTEVVGVTGDFDGGSVQANTVISTNLGVGQWMTAQFRIDGVSQGPNASIYQSGATASVVHAMILRVPQGRHRVSVYFVSSVAPVSSCSADLSVAELNA
jgi:hypothetical protein